MIFEKETRTILKHDITSQRGNIIKKGTQIIIEGHTEDESHIYYFVKNPELKTDGINILDSSDLKLDQQYYRNQKLNEILK